MHFRSIISLGVLTIAGSIISASPIPKDESGLSTGDKVVVGLSVGGGLLALGAVGLFAHGRLKTPKATADILNPSGFHSPPSAGVDLPHGSHSGHGSQRLSGDHSGDLVNNRGHQNGHDLPGASHDQGVPSFQPGPKAPRPDRPVRNFGTAPKLPVDHASVPASNALGGADGGIHASGH